MSSIDNAAADLARGLEGAFNEQGSEETAPAAPLTPQPTTPAGNGAPQQAAPAVEAQGTADPALWQRLGYSDSETLERSVLNLRNYASQTKDEATALRQENEALKQQMAGRVDPRGFPQGYGPTPQAADPLDVLESEFKVPRSLLEPGVDRLVNERVNALLSPFVQAAQAEQATVQKYGPEYAANKHRIEAYVASQPDVARLVNAARAGGLPELANELAITKFREAFYAERHAGITAAAGATQGAVANARSHAGILAGRGEETRTQLAQQQAGTSPIDRNEAIARANAGDESLLERKASEMLPFTEEQLQRVWRGEIVM